MPHANPAIVNDPFARRLAFVYAAFFGTTGWYLPFFPVWLAARGLDPAAIGVVLAAFQLVRIVATPAGTRLADRHGSLSASIAAAALATVGAMALLAFTSSFPAVLAAVILMSFVSAPIMPLIDAYALKGLGLRGRAYGPVRLWGSVAFIAAMMQLPAKMSQIRFAGAIRSKISPPATLAAMNATEPHSRTGP